MPSVYLQSYDYAAYGVPNATTQQVTQASSLIDGYLKRSEGLIWVPDANGNPCYMANKPPFVALQATSDFNAGQNVNVNVSGPAQAVSLGSSQCGLVAVLDRANPSITEACIVNAVTVNQPPTPSVVQLTNVQFNHSTDCLLEFGMCIFDEVQMPPARPLANLSRTPIIQILAGQGRYGYPRRGNSYFEINEYNLLAAITKFGGPPVWEIFNQNLVGVDPNTGNVWAPAGILLAYYTEIRFSYIAGYTYQSLPPNIKQACANLINASVNFPMNGAIKNMRAGDTALEFFAATVFSDDTKNLLDPYMARMLI
jgi:hypothetical protein